MARVPEHPNIESVREAALATRAAPRIPHFSMLGSTPGEILMRLRYAKLLQLRRIDHSALIHGYDVGRQFLFLGRIEPGLAADFDIDIVDQFELFRTESSKTVGIDSIVHREFLPFMRFSLNAHSVLSFPFIFT